jgi:hypothetical protein
MAPAPLDHTAISGAFQTIARADLSEVLDALDSLSPPHKGRLADRLFEVQSHLGLTYAGALQSFANADLTDVLDAVERLSPPDKILLSDRLGELLSHLGLAGGQN